MIGTLHEGLLADKIAVPLTKLCAWFGGPHRTICYTPRKAAPKGDPGVAEPVKAMIAAAPSFGYPDGRMAAGLQQEHGAADLPAQGLAGPQAGGEPAPPIQTVPSAAEAPHEHGSTDLACLDGKGWRGLAGAGDRLPHARFRAGTCRGPEKATTASAAMEHALIVRFGTLGRGKEEEAFPRADNGQVFTSRPFTALVRSHGLKQAFITPHCPQQNGMVARVIRTLKKQCGQRHRFESLPHAPRLLQHPPPSSGACHAHACRGIQSSGLT